MLCMAWRSTSDLLGATRVNRQQTVCRPPRKSLPKRACLHTGTPTQAGRCRDVGYVRSASRRVQDTGAKHQKRKRKRRKKTKHTDTHPGCRPSRPLTFHARGGGYPHKDLPVQHIFLDKLQISPARSLSAPTHQHQLVDAVHIFLQAQANVHSCYKNIMATRAPAVYVLFLKGRVQHATRSPPSTPPPHQPPARVFIAQALARLALLGVFRTPPPPPPGCGETGSSSPSDADLFLGVFLRVAGWSSAVATGLSGLFLLPLPPLADPTPTASEAGGVALVACFLPDAFGVLGVDAAAAGLLSFDFAGVVLAFAAFAGVTVDAAFAGVFLALDGLAGVAVLSPPFVGVFLVFAAFVGVTVSFTFAGVFLAFAAFAGVAVLATFAGVFLALAGLAEAPVFPPTFTGVAFLAFPPLLEEGGAASSKVIAGVEGSVLSSTAFRFLDGFSCHAPFLGFGEQREGGTNGGGSRSAVVLPYKRKEKFIAHQTHPRRFNIFFSSPT